MFGKILPTLGMLVAFVTGGAVDAQTTSPMPMGSGSPMPMSSGSPMPMSGSSAMPMNGSSAMPMSGSSAMPMDNSSAMPMSGASAMPMNGSSAMPMHHGSMMMGGSKMSGGMMGGSMDHGMPTGKMGADGTPYKGTPSLQTAISLVTAGGPPGHFSITKAVASLAGPSVATAEVTKLTKQYGATKVKSFVTVQNFAVNDAVRIALAAGVKFPTPMIHGKALAVAVTKYGVEDGAYYEGPMLDHLVTNKIHEQVMDDIDSKYGTKADANYHRIADQAHYDLAQALGATSVMLAPYH